MLHAIYKYITNTKYQIYIYVYICVYIKYKYHIYILYILYNTVKYIAYVSIYYDNFYSYWKKPNILINKLKIKNKLNIRNII